MEYTVTIVNVDTDTALYSLAPFYVESRALYSARKESRRLHGPSVVVRVDCDRRDYPKLFRMGRLHRTP